MKARIIISVFSVHLIVLFLILFISSSKPLLIISNSKKIKVYSIEEEKRGHPQLTLPLKREENSSIAKVERANISNSPKSAIEQPKKVESSLHRKSKNTKATPVPRTSSNRTREWVEESLAKIEKRAYNDRLQLESKRLHQPENHKVEERLIEFLQNSLILPEIGEVKVRLLIYSNGAIGQVAAIKSESERNKKYLEEKLPSLKVPFPLPAEKVITVTFSNDV